KPIEQQLFERAVGGDKSALNQLFAQNNRALYQTALRLLGNPEDAEDALQEGMPAADRLADDGPSPEELYAGTELAARLNENLEGLSPLLRHAFELREIEGLSADEAAKALGVSRNTLKARLWRARQQLGTRLGTVLRHHMPHR